jgi:hypothetical protein
MTRLIRHPKFSLAFLVTGALPSGIFFALEI